MNQPQGFDFFVNDWYFGCLWGTATVKYSNDYPSLSGRYGFQLDGSHGCWWVDEIKRRKEAVEPIKEVASVR